jgi:Glycosyltransferase family 87
MPIRNGKALTCLRWVTFACLLAVMAWQLRSLARHFPVNDLVEYWSAAHLLVHTGNPYSPTEMQALQQAVGRTEPAPLLLWNPPWALTFIAPLSLLSYPAALILWLAIGLAIAIVCADRLWVYYGGAPRQRYLAWIVALTFVPTLAVLALGQIGPFILLGITLFLLWHDRYPIWAGAATVLIGLKPQLFYLFWIALLLWLIRARRWRVIAGAVIAFAASSLLPWLFDHAIFSQYFEQFHAARLLSNPSPNLGTLLRWYVSPSWNWLQFAPSAVGAVWFIWYWKKAGDWEWTTGIPLLLSVAIATTSYGWLFDHIVLLPAVLQIAAMVVQRRDTARTWAVALPYLLVNLILVMFIVLRQGGVAYAWVAPAWLVWYLASWATLHRIKRQGDERTVQYRKSVAIR